MNKYVAPFGYDFTADGTLDTTINGTPLHDILALVYKQNNGRVSPKKQMHVRNHSTFSTFQVEMNDERQNTCDPSIAARIGDHAALAEKYNMQLVAGNFLFTTYTKGTNPLLCYFTKCTGAPFPVPVPGINDQPDCQ